MQSVGEGILQIASDYKNLTDIEGEFSLIKHVARDADRLLTVPMAQTHSQPEGWREVMTLVEQANAEGMRVTAQVLPRGIGMLFGLELSMHPFCLAPSYQAIQHLPISARLAKMREPALRSRIISEAPNNPATPLLNFIRKFDGMFEVDDPLDYEPSLDRSITARANALGVAPAELAYDLLLKGEGRVSLFLPFANYAYGNLDATLELFRHKDAVVGLGDGGAHYGVICDASYSTFLLSHWTRDRSRGERLSVAEVVKALARDTSAMIGLHDRGLLARGYKADVNIIDYDRLALHSPQVAFDLPAGGRRLTQKADGYVATIVNGQVVYRDGNPTGALPGLLIRGHQPAPAEANLSRTMNVGAVP
jgi:N-acyl-D-aspartate/D-glutamate deacylase